MYSAEYGIQYCFALNFIQKLSIDSYITGFILITIDLYRRQRVSFAYSSMLNFLLWNFGVFSYNIVNIIVIFLVTSLSLW